MKSINIIIVFLATSICQTSFCQEKTNSIVFAEMILGYSNGGIKGFTGGGLLNYQLKKSLIVYRYLEVSQVRKNGQFLFIPFYIETQRIKEQALMYGRRIVDENSSLSYSAGISYNDNEYLIDVTDNFLKYESVKSIGFPFEINIKWFNSTKKRYRIYELIPIGKPTGFANSIGFKLYGNLSKNAFIGIGLTLGIGYHKNY